MTNRIKDNELSTCQRMSYNPDTQDFTGLQEFQPRRDNVTVICKDFSQEHATITVNEFQFMLRKAGRHSPYYTMWLLRAHVGLRSRECISIQLSQFQNNFRKLTYIVDKPRCGSTAKGEKVEIRKVRTVYLDEWVASEMKAYCKKHMVVIDNKDGTESYMSPINLPHKTGLFFPWKSILIPLSYWAKMKKHMLCAGYKADRLEKSYERQVNNRIMRSDVYVVRSHMLRHISASIYYAKHGQDMKATQKWIAHERIETTSKYIHPASEMGVTQKWLETASWSEIAGWGDAEIINSSRVIQEQTVLDMFRGYPAT